MLFIGGGQGVICFNAELIFFNAALLNMLGCTAQHLTTKDYLTQNVNKFEIKKFGFNLKEMSFLDKSIFPSVVAFFRR